MVLSIYRNERSSTHKHQNFNSRINTSTQFVLFQIECLSRPQKNIPDICNLIEWISTYHFQKWFMLHTQPLSEFMRSTLKQESKVNIQ